MVFWTSDRNIALVPSMAYSWFYMFWIWMCQMWLCNYASFRTCWCHPNSHAIRSWMDIFINMKNIKLYEHQTTYNQRVLAYKRYLIACLKWPSLWWFRQCLTNCPWSCIMHENLKTKIMESNHSHISKLFWWNCEVVIDIGSYIIFALCPIIQ